MHIMSMCVWEVKCNHHIDVMIVRKCREPTIFKGVLILNETPGPVCNVGVERLTRDLLELVYTTLLDHVPAGSDNQKFCTKISIAATCR